MSLSAVPEQYRSLRSFAFGDGPEPADRLLELVLSGLKTATCSTEDEPNTSSLGERWIVLDGGQHFSDGQEAADARRSAIIEAAGFQVLRFSNHDVMTNRPGVLETIATAIAARAPTLTLPRKREREQDVPDGKRES